MTEAPISRTCHEQAALWCVAISEDTLSSAEQAELEMWLAEPRNAAAFHDAVRIWRATDQIAEIPEVIQLRVGALTSYQRAARRHLLKRVIHDRSVWAAAAAILLCVALSLAYFLYIPVERYETAAGERRIVVLDDGSTLTLDADSRVGVRLGREHRQLVLERGRAKFDVAQDSMRPFSVAAKGTVVVATGTSFSVELLRNEMRTILYEGHVAVSNERTLRPVIGKRLEAGEELIVPLQLGRKPVVLNVDRTNSASWLTGQISFDDEPLETAIERLNRYNRVKFAIGDRRAAGLRVNGVFQAGDNQAFIDAVTGLTPVRAIHRDRQIILSMD